MDFTLNTRESRANVLKYIQRLPIEKRPYKVRILRLSNERTGEQNRYMWFVFSSLAVEFSTDRNTVHDFFSQLFLRVIDRLGNHEFDRIRKTSELTTAEHSEFMEQVRIWASVEHGIIVPLPGETSESER